VGDVGCNFGEVPNRSWSIRAQKVGLDKDAIHLDPHKKVIGGAAVLDAAEGAVAEEIAANADVHFVLSLDSGRRYGAEFLEFIFSSGEQSRFKNHLFIIGWVA